MLKVAQSIERGRSYKPDAPASACISGTRQVGSVAGKLELLEPGVLFQWLAAMTSVAMAQSQGTRSPKRA